MEKVAEAPCKEFMRWWESGAACDEHLADELVLAPVFRRGPEPLDNAACHRSSAHRSSGRAQHFLPIEAQLKRTRTAPARSFCKALERSAVL
jgi:RNA 3'-terminal phosphate cyclase